ncbi:nuclear transport factor 2 family protein [Arthrobacter sp. I2-34]|uniref:Nuclear transport factor 2 family protein n=1 Tax=Arthrobacter hankyongi TaxID=2904801 RepID=A0ABS9LDN4_9MICC|nr:nuclear transport factor 2 family protein [Arthrobacter hankyongi]MCG2624807.1 nuclear transport factor 2 family protein [Arthrobacter hankyongi]
MPAAAGAQSGTVRAFWDAQAAGDAAAARAVLAEDLEWTVAGRHSGLARTYRGREAFFGELIATLSATFEPGSAVMDIRGIYEDTARSTVVTHLRETARTRTGLEFDNEIVTIMTVEDGRITACREFMDLHEVRRTFGGDTADPHQM